MKTIICRIVFFLLFVAFLVNLANAQPRAKVISETNNGLTSVQFDTPNGQVIAYLPTNIYTGDIISGTVVAEPKGKNEKQISKNKNILNGMVVELDDKDAPVENNKLTWQIPEIIEDGISYLILKNSKGKELAKTPISIIETPRDFFLPDELSELDFIIPEYFRAGETEMIHGMFDGDFSNSAIKINDVETNILAESPEGIFFETPEDISGPVDVELTEGDFSLEEQTNVLDLELSANKLNLLKGEQTKVYIAVSGLEGLDEEIPLEITNLTLGNINMEGGNKQEIIIEPDDVLDDGTFQYDLDVTAISAGGFSVLVNIEPPYSGIIKLSSPFDGETIDTSTPTFEWESSGLADNYTLTIWQLPEEITEEMIFSKDNLVDMKPYFVKEGIKEPFFFYMDTTDYPLVPWNNYFCQVKGEFEGRIIQSKIQGFSETWESFSRMVWKTTAKCMKNAGIIFNSTLSANELPDSFTEASNAFQPLLLMFKDCPKKDESHYMIFLEFASLLNSVGEAWERGDINRVSILLEKAGQIFDNSGGLQEDSELSSLFTEIGKSLYLFSGLTELQANQQVIMEEMEELNKIYPTLDADSVSKMFNNISGSLDTEIDRWIYNGCFVDVPEIDSFSPLIVDSILTIFFKDYVDSPKKFQDWLYISAKETSVLATKEFGNALVRFGENMLLGIKLTCKNTCSPEGNRKEKVFVKVGLTEGNSQSAFIWLLAHAPRRSPGFGAVSSLLPDVLGKLKQALIRNQYTRIWIKIEYFECKKTACYGFWDELDWDDIKTVGWKLLSPPNNITYRNQAVRGDPAWHGTRQWDNQNGLIKKKIQELIQQKVLANMPN
jgi:hypothetical protein